MKKAICTALAVLLSVLFIPIPKGTFDDGGTREYAALTYKIVVWNKINITIDENGKILEIKQSAEDVALPVIVGTNVTEFGIGNMIKIDDEDKQKTVFDIVKQLGTAEIRDSIKTIDVFDLNDIRFFTISEATVNMGSMDDMIYKIAFLKKILEDNGDNRGAFIDMTNTDKVTVRGS